ncbi:unnamed protein product, partial [Chrysoparadoxa australica]
LILVSLCSCGAFVPQLGGNGATRSRRNFGMAKEPEDAFERALQEALKLSDESSKLPSLEDFQTKKAGGTKMKGFGAMGGGDIRVAQNDALKDWLGNNGVWVFDRSDWGKAPHSLAVAIDTVDEYENEKAGRGMMADREMKEGDLLFSMPLDLLLTKAKAQEILGRNVITDDLSEYIAIALLLVGEKAKGADSFWKPYIDILPTVDEVYPTYCWTQEDLDSLEGSPVVRATESMKLKLRKEYEALLEPGGVIYKHKDMFPTEVYTYDNFEWAFAMLFSRAIRLTSLSSGEAIALIPYADLFNHNPFANSYIDARETGMITKVDEVAVYADRGYKRMEQ